MVAVKVIALLLFLCGTAFGQQNAPDRSAPGNAISVRCVTPDGSSFESCGATLLGGGSGVTSIAKSGSTALVGDVTLSAGANIALTQTGQDIAIAVTGLSGANAALSNLASVSINTSLLAQSGVDLGSAAAPFRSGFLSSTSADTTGGKLNCYKSRSGGVITTADVLCDMDFYGHDGSNQVLAGRIRSVSTGTIGSTRVPATLEFWTPTNAAPSVLTKALTLGADQSANFANNVAITPQSNSGTTLRINAVDGTSRIQLGTAADPIYSGIWFGNLTPSDSNYAFLGDGTSATVFNAPGSGSRVIFRINNVQAPNALSVNNTGIIIGSPSFPSVGKIEVVGSANLHILKATGYTNTSGTAEMVRWDGTLNQAAAAVDLIGVHATVTSTHANSKLFNLYGGASGTTSVFSVGTAGAVNAASYSTAGTAGLSSTISVRKGDDSAACNLVVTGGLVTSTTC